MIRSVNMLFLAGLLAYASFAQSAPAAPPTTASEDRAGAYYNFAMGRLYAELAAAEGSQGDVRKAIHYYQEAIKLAPKEALILGELTDLYIKTNRLADAVEQAEGVLKLDPTNLEARRTLAQIYTHLAVGETRDAKIDNDYLHKAIEQYRKITEQDAKDVESWSYLGKLHRASGDSAAAEKAFHSALLAEPDNEEAMMGLAAVYSDLGDPVKALATLKALADKSPNQSTLGALAQQYEIMNDPKSAAAALARAVALEPDDERLQRDLAQDLIEAGQIDESLKVYRQLAANNPREIGYRLRVAELCRVKRDFPAAEKAVAEALLLDSDNVRVREEQALLLDAEGKIDEAIAGMKSLLDALPRRSRTADAAKLRAELALRLAGLYREAKQYPAAIEALRQYAALETDDDAQPKVTEEIVETYRVSGDLGAAEREAQAGIKKFAGNRAAARTLELELAQIYMQGKRSNDMAKALDRAAQLAATEKEKADTTVQIVETYRASGELAAAEREAQAGLAKLADREAGRELEIELAQVYEQAKRWDEMAKAFDRAERLATTDKEIEMVYFARGAGLEREKKYEQSEAAFRKVLELNPKNAGALNYLGYTLADRNVRLEEAFALIKQALDLDPDNAAYLDSLGWVYYRQGKLDDARGLLERAVNRMEDPTVHDHLGDVYLKLGKTKEAVVQWQDSLREFAKAVQPEADPEEMANVNRKLDDAQAKLAAETHAK